MSLVVSLSLSPQPFSPRNSRNRRDEGSFQFQLEGLHGPPWSLTCPVSTFSRPYDEFLIMEVLSGESRLLPPLCSLSPLNGPLSIVSRGDRRACCPWG